MKCGKKFPSSESHDMLLCNMCKAPLQIREGSEIITFVFNYYYCFCKVTLYPMKDNYYVQFRIVKTVMKHHVRNPSLAKYLGNWLIVWTFSPCFFLPPSSEKNILRHLGSYLHFAFL